MWFTSLFLFPYIFSQISLVGTRKHNINDIKYISSHGLIQKYFYFLLMLHKNSNLRVIEFYTEIQKTAANCNIE